MSQREEIKISNSMYFMTGQSFCVLERKAGRLDSVLFSFPSPCSMWKENWTRATEWATLFAVIVSS